ncbi:hypothetical protein HUJ04_004342 [Dendroctonus ponderosae]|nr:hypothetical protein HUJ04_004342 [Dendroctonus ponderosae]
MFAVCIKVGLIGSKKSLTLLLLLFSAYCDAKAIDALKDDPSTTPCPEELNEATTTVQATEEETERSTAQEVTTLCPEELEKRRQNELISNNDKLAEKVTEKLPEDAEIKYDSSKEIAEDVTTECPEELEKRRSEANSSSSKQDSSIASENSEQNDEEQRYEVDSSANESGVEVAETTICPEEAAERQTKDKPVEEPDREADEGGSTSITECPEELAKKEAEKPEEAEKEEEISAPSEVATTTECPEELAKRQQQEKSPTLIDQLPQEHKLHRFSSSDLADIQTKEISAKTLLGVQKDSALLKVVKEQMQNTLANQEETMHRTKRQTAADYSQYYANQPRYDSQGQTANLKESSQNFQPSQSQSNTQKASYNNVHESDDSSDECSGVPVVNLNTTPVSPLTGPNQGYNVHPDISDLLSTVLHKGRSYDSRQFALTSYPLLGNCSALNPPQVNPEIKTNLIESHQIALNKDEFLRKVQLQLAAGISALAVPLDQQYERSRLDRSEVARKELATISDPIKIFSDVFHSISVHRRRLLTPLAKVGLRSGQMRALPYDDMLFGNCLAEWIRKPQIKVNTSLPTMDTQPIKHNVQNNAPVSNTNAQSTSTPKPPSQSHTPTITRNGNEQNSRLKMRLFTSLMGVKQKARARPQEPVPFKEILPLKLKPGVSGKGNKMSNLSCLYEMSILFACLSNSEFQQQPCGKEITSFQKCYSTYTSDKKQKSERDMKGILTPGLTNRKMPVLKCYYDLLSQPSRAVYIFLKVANIPFQSCPVALRTGEHQTDDFKESMNRFQKVPFILHGDFKLAESVAIVTCLDQLEELWLSPELKYIAGDSISVADIFAASELEQTRLAAYDVTKDRPILKAWLERVREECNPVYSEAHAVLNRLVAKNSQSKL